MKIPLIVAAAAALTFTASLSQATVVNSTYTSLGGDSWLVDFTVVNDGTPASFAALTIDLPNATNLVLVASPSAWDGRVFQPDGGLGDSGFVDLYNPLNTLGIGQSFGGIEVSFKYSAGAMPGSTPFMVYDSAFAPLFAGNTTVVAAIPEPATVVLTALGLAFVGLRTLRKPTRISNTSKEVTA